MFDKSSVGRNSSGQWIGALHLLRDPQSMLELLVLSWELLPATQCWTDQLALGLSCKLLQVHSPSQFLNNTFSLRFFCLISDVCVGSVMESLFTSKVLLVVGVNDFLTSNGIFLKNCVGGMEVFEYDDKKLSFL